MFKLPRKNLTVLIIAACAIILIFNSFSCLKNSTQKAFKPQLSLLGLIKQELSGIIFYHRNMIMANELNNQVGLLRWRLFEFREIVQENNRLKSLLNFKQKSPLRLIAARVIGRSIDNWSANLILDKGLSSWIKTGMVVVGPQGLIGKIVESNDSTSKVLLINDPSQGVSSIVQRSRQEGLVSGTLSGNLIMRYLPDDADVVIGDTVITSELSQVYPKGLLIGKIINVGKDFSGLCRYAIVKPAVDPAGIEEVLIILP
ncbi:MAG: rod shape-determining protein MreC [Candidatus Omnitrophota bacterium]